MAFASSTTYLIQVFYEPPADGPAIICSILFCSVSSSLKLVFPTLDQDNDSWVNIYLRNVIRRYIGLRRQRREGTKLAAINFWAISVICWWNFSFCKSHRKAFIYFTLLYLQENRADDLFAPKTVSNCFCHPKQLKIRRESDSESELLFLDWMKFQQLHDLGNATNRWTWFGDLGWHVRASGRCVESGWIFSLF